MIALDWHFLWEDTSEALRLLLLEALRAMPELVAVNEPHVARRCHEVFVGETWNDVWHLMMRVIPKHQQVKLQSLIYIQFVVNHKFYWWLMDVLTMTSHNWTFFVVHETSLFVFSLGCPHVLCSFFVRFEHPPQWVSGPAQWTGADGVSNGWSDRTTISV